MNHFAASLLFVCIIGMTVFLTRISSPTLESPAFAEPAVKPEAGNLKPINQVVVFPRPSPRKTSVCFARVLNTGPQPSDGRVREFTWRNNTGSDLLIRYAQLWCGVAMGTRADTNGEVTRDSDGQLLWDLGWDRYAEVTGPNHQKEWNYPKDFDFILSAGDTLRLRCFGNPLPSSISKPGHHFVLTLGAQWLTPPE